MKKYLAGLAIIGLLFGVSVSAKIESFSARSEDGTVVVTITKNPCPESIQAKVNPDYRKYLKEAMVSFKGTKLAACWLQLPDNTVGIIDEQGDTGNIPISEFKPDIDV